MDLFEQAGIHVPDLNETRLADYIDPSIPRFHHILGVVRKMKSLLTQLNILEEWKALLIQACYLHDIGYSPKLDLYHYHQLDGAIFAAKQGYPKYIVATILFHSCAYEGVIYSRPDIRKVYEHHLSLLDDKDQMFIDLVSYCDLHTSADGEDTNLAQRVKNVIERYGDTHEVSKIMLSNVPHFRQIIDRVTKLIKQNKKGYK
ncbi:HD domain-containing protein [Shimazuella sp. AN120528]|uniref:HD domain-containing protein n=1 Tax=Shimazuella soli TaxID=1892854 RepID=UPI001F0EF97A|nr:HD domain-containing protein [Shimazuella soli]MCH5583705.1 HD domain-containing protein [Shimazuella soli]